MLLKFDDDDVRALVRPVVREVISELNELPQDNRLGYSEPEAATLLGLAAHQLRDARLRGEIVATRLGGRIGYERSELLRYMAAGRRDL